MITTSDYKTAPSTSEWSEQDKIGMAKAIEQAELGLSEGQLLHSSRNLSSIY
jgi:hypothetical protein